MEQKNNDLVVACNRLLRIVSGILESGVNDKTSYHNALMCLRQLDTISAGVKSLYADIAAKMTYLSDEAAKYAIKHPTALDGPGLVDGIDGSRSGSVTLDDGYNYRLSIVADRVRRIDRGKMVKEFVDLLPKSWLVCKKEFSLTAASASIMKIENERVRKNPSCKPKKFDDYLADYGLKQGTVNKWQFQREGQKGG